MFRYTLKAMCLPSASSDFVLLDISKHDMLSRNHYQPMRHVNWDGFRLQCVEPIDFFPRLASMRPTIARNPASNKELLTRPPASSMLTSLAIQTSDHNRRGAAGLTIVDPEPWEITIGLSGYIARYSPSQSAAERRT